MSHYFPGAQPDSGSVGAKHEGGVANNQSSSFQGGLHASSSSGVWPVWQSVSELRAPDSSPSRRKRRTGCALTHVFAHFSSPSPNPPRVLSDAACNPSTRREHTSDGRAMDSLGSRCKIVVVGDTQCGKTALLHVFAKDCYPEVRLRQVWT